MNRKTYRFSIKCASCRSSSTQSYLVNWLHGETTWMLGCHTNDTGPGTSGLSGPECLATKVRECQSELYGTSLATLYTRPMARSTLDMAMGNKNTATVVCWEEFGMYIRLYIVKEMDDRG